MVLSAEINQGKPIDDELSFIHESRANVSSLNDLVKDVFAC